MADDEPTIPDWRLFEQMVARIEADACPTDLIVKSPDRIRSLVTGDMREVDASVRSRVGGTERLVTIECRKRAAKEDITWIEQLAAKKDAIGATRTIAVSSAGFSQQAKQAAAQYGIDLRLLSELTVTDVNPFLRLDVVLFNLRRCSIANVGLRRFRGAPWTMPSADDIDFEFVRTIDPFEPVFLNVEAGNRWSINDLWHQLQEACNPFAGIERGAAPVIRTACFPYPGNVTVETAAGPQRLGEVFLSVSLQIEVEQVTLGEANKIGYAGTGGVDLQRVEFRSMAHAQGEWSISIQSPRTSSNPEDVRTRFVGAEGGLQTTLDP